jgi:hypothetical protein
LLARANDDTTAELWSSISDILPSLAEAAPSVFLSALREASEGDDPIVAKLFTDKVQTLSVNSPHTGLLWAIEGIGWSQQYFSEVVITLVRLVEIDPGGILANRPAETLRNLFWPQLPQTQASPSVRLEVLDTIISRNPDSAWKLLLGLLSQVSGLITQHHMFSFRPWRGTDTRPALAEQVEQISNIVDRALLIADAEPARWKDLAEYALRLPSDDRVKICVSLSTLKVAELSSDDRVAIFEGVMRQVRHHQSFPDSAWSLEPVELGQFTQAAAHIRPDDIVETNRWLFEEWHPDLGYKKSNDFAVYDADLATRRAIAVGDIYTAKGLGGTDRPELAGWFCSRAATGG